MLLTLSPRSQFWLCISTFGLDLDYVLDCSYDGFFYDGIDYGYVFWNFDFGFSFCCAVCLSSAGCCVCSLLPPLLPEDE